MDMGIWWDQRMWMRGDRVIYDQDEIIGGAVQFHQSYPVHWTRKEE